MNELKIIDEAAVAFGVTRKAILSGKREKRNVTDARHTAMYYLHTKHGWSKAQIGRAIGNMSAAAAHHGCICVSDLYDTNDEVTDKMGRAMIRTDCFLQEAHFKRRHGIDLVSKPCS